MNKIEFINKKKIKSDIKTLQEYILEGVVFTIDEKRNLIKEFLKIWVSESNLSIPEDFYLTFKFPSRGKSIVIINEFLSYGDLIFEVGYEIAIEFLISKNKETYIDVINKPFYFNSNKFLTLLKDCNRIENTYKQKLIEDINTSRLSYSEKLNEFERKNHFMTGPDIDMLNETKENKQKEHVCDSHEDGA